MLTSFFVGAKSFNRAGLSVARRHLAVDALHHKPTSVSRKPVIFLDVDGVINCFGSGWAKQLWSDTTEIQVAVPSNKNNELREFNIVYSPTVVKKINEWSKIADIHWLTSWGERANTHLVPAIGLEGPFATLPHDVRNEQGPSKVECAHAFADKMHPDQLVIWVDDHLLHWVEVPDEGLPSCRHNFGVVMRPNSLYVAPKIGLTRRDVELVDRHLADPALAKGKLIYAFKMTEDKSCTVRTFMLNTTLQCSTTLAAGTKE